jgi:hypothetical protein
MDMRELTILDTGYLAVLLVLSLVLPLLMSSQPEALKSRCIRTVWMGQALLASAGLAVLVSARITPYAAACGLVGCFCCALLLLRRFRAVRLA